jgi:hypothetical protein
MAELAQHVRGEQESAAVEGGKPALSLKAETSDDEDAIALEPARIDPETREPLTLVSRPEPGGVEEDPYDFGRVAGGGMKNRVQT